MAAGSVRSQARSAWSPDLERVATGKLSVWHCSETAWPR